MDAVKVRNSQFASVSASEASNFRRWAEHYGLSTKGLVFASRDIAKGTHFYYEFANGLECRVAVFLNTNGIFFKADRRNGYVPYDSMANAYNFDTAEDVNGYLRNIRNQKRRPDSTETDDDSWVSKGAEGKRLQDILEEDVYEALRKSMPVRP